MRDPVALARFANSNVPRSSRFANNPNPLRSHARIFTRSRRRLRKTKKCPENGSSWNESRTMACRPSKAFRKSTEFRARKTRTDDGKLSMTTTPRSDGEERRRRSRERRELLLPMGDRSRTRWIASRSSVNSHSRGCSPLANRQAPASSPIRRSSVAPSSGTLSVAVPSTEAATPAPRQSQRALARSGARALADPGFDRSRRRSAT